MGRSYDSLNMSRFKLGYKVGNQHFRSCWKLTPAKICQDIVYLIVNGFYLIYKYVNKLLGNDQIMMKIVEI